MKVTFDDQADASYVYFTKIGVGGVAKTFTDQELEVVLDSDEQIVSLKLPESEDCVFQKRLNYLRLHSEVTYLEREGALHIVFASDALSTRSMSWDCNVDVDGEGQILGLEILFAPPGYAPDDGQERLSAQGKLAHISKYLVPFDEFY